MCSQHKARPGYTDDFRRLVAQAAFYGGNAKETAARFDVTYERARNWRRRYYGNVQGAQWGIISRILRDHGPMKAAQMRPLYEAATGIPVSSRHLSTKIGNEWRRGRLDRERVAGRWVYRIKAQ